MGGRLNDALKLNGRRVVPLLLAAKLLNPALVAGDARDQIAALAPQIFKGGRAVLDCHGAGSLLRCWSLRQIKNPRLPQFAI